MSFMNAFRKSGVTSSVAVTTTGSAAIQPSTGSAQCMMAAYFGSTAPCFIEIGTTAVIATVPTTSTPGSMPLIANTQRVFTIPPNGYVSVVASSAGGTFYMTPGDGIN